MDARMEGWREGRSDEYLCRTACLQQAPQSVQSDQGAESAHAAAPHAAEHGSAGRHHAHTLPGTPLHARRWAPCRAAHIAGELKHI